MKEERLLRAMTEVREEYIQEAKPPARPRRNPWKMGVSLAACACLAGILIGLPRVFEGLGAGSEPPETYFPYGVVTEGETAYFSANGRMYCHQAGERRAVKLAEFRGVYWDTSSGCYGVNEGTGEVYTVEGEKLTPLTTIDATGRYTILGERKGELYWSSQYSANTTTREMLLCRTNCKTGETETLASIPEGEDAGWMRDGKIYFKVDGYHFRYYDLATGELVDFHESFWGKKAEAFDPPLYYEDLILCRCIQYVEDGAGGYTSGGHPYYRLDYDTGALTYLTEFTSLSGEPSLLDGVLYYVSLTESWMAGDTSRSKYALRACDTITGEVTTLATGDRQVDELVVTAHGLYYAEEGDLYYYDLEQETSRKLIDK